MSGISSLGWLNAEKFSSQEFACLSPKQLSKLLDHMELRAICHIDKRYSTGEVFNLTDDEQAFSDEVLSTAEVLSEIAENEIEVYPNRVSHQEMMRFIRIRFSRRQEKWRDFWPFELVVQESNHCEIAFLPQHSYAELYVYCLLTLYSRYLKNTEANLYRNHFECFCLPLASTIFPATAGWSVKHMGAAATGNHTYQGNTLQKIQQLSTDLCLANKQLLRRPSTSGDLGLDLVAFNKQPFDDIGCLPFVTMQCATSSNPDELERKTADSSHSRLSQWMNLDIVHSHILFSFYDWYDHQQDGHFVVPTNRAIVFDRGRILNNMVQHQIKPVLLPEMQKHIQEFIALEETFD